MALFTTADLLRRAKVILNRPATDEVFTVSSTDDVWYDFLTQAQIEVHGTLASIVPDAMYNSLTLLTTADSGASFTFGTDADSDNITPYGHFEVYPTLNSFPDGPLVEGVDFIYEGSKLRIPNGRTIDTPYARWVTPPNVIASGTEPTLLPKRARLLIAYKAAALAAKQRLKQDPSSYEESYQSLLASILLGIKTAAFGLGGRANGRRDVDVGWWRGNPDLG